MCTLSAWGTWLFVLTAGLGHDAQEAFIWLARGCNAASVVVMNVMTPEVRRAGRLVLWGACMWLGLAATVGGGGS